MAQCFKIEKTPGLSIPEGDFVLFNDIDKGLRLVSLGTKIAELNPCATELFKGVKDCSY